MEALQAERVRAQVLQRAGIDLPVAVHASLDSTNNWCLEQCRQGATLPFACFARQQTDGRGRRGKSWLMATDASIAMSLAWQTGASTDGRYLSLSVAMSVVAVLESLGLAQVSIKWPNDVYVSGQKIAGILVDAIPGQAPSQRCYIIGIGLNVDMRSARAALDTAGVAYTDLYSQVTPVNMDLSVLAGDLLANLLGMLAGYPQNVLALQQTFSTTYDYCRGRELQVLLDNGERVTGLGMGISESGALKVKTSEGVIEFDSADVSIKV